MNNDTKTKEEVTKIDDTTFEVTRTVEKPTEEKITHNLDFLIQQETNILKDRSDYFETRTRELDEVRALIAKARELGLKTTAELEQERADTITSA